MDARETTDTKSSIQAQMSSYPESNEALKVAVGGNAQYDTHGTTERRSKPPHMNDAQQSPKAVQMRR